MLLSCTLTLTSCDILLMALMMGMTSDTYVPTNTYYPYYSPVPNLTSTSSSNSTGSGVNSSSNYWKEHYGDVKCHLCNGTGVCSTCNGDGWFYGSYGTGKLKCPNCDTSQVGRCGRCGGKGTVYGLKR